MFKKEFKYYKSRSSLPKWDQIIDFNGIIHCNALNMTTRVTDYPPLNYLYERKQLEITPKAKSITTKQNESILVTPVTKRDPCTVNTSQVGTPQRYGLKGIENWQMFQLTDKPGLIFISNPFTRDGQQYWVERCLKDYTQKPNRLNLDHFGELKPSEDWWEVASIDDERGHLLIQKLRWATLGYHHNWDSKEYSEDDRSEFPPDLARLSSLIVQAVEGLRGESYLAQAAIVNFYHMDSTLSGHRDVSEPNSSSPLISISFGQSAIFLLGGETLDDSVSALLIRSGDVVIMTGPARLCYHGVPRILPAGERPWAGEGWEETALGRYLETSRININVRQVLLPGEHSLNRFKNSQVNNSQRIDSNRTIKSFE